MTSNHRLQGFALACATVTVFAAFFIVMYLAHAPHADACPAGHVRVEHGEIPQTGCMPEGTARELGVWP